MRRLALPLIVGLLLVSCGKQSITILSPDSTEAVTVNAELAVTPKEQQRGLMGRTYLPEDTGMMFVFEQDQPLSFWMKNTLVPLQILYFSSDGYFVNALDMVPCEEDPCEQYRSASVAKYALEVNVGFREANDIGTGWHLDAVTLATLAR